MLTTMEDVDDDGEQEKYIKKLINICLGHVITKPVLIRFPLKNRYKWCKKNIDQLLDVLLLVAFDDEHGGRHVPEVPKTILIQVPLKK